MEVIVVTTVVKLVIIFVKVEITDVINLLVVAANIEYKITDVTEMDSYIIWKIFCIKIVKNDKYWIDITVTSVVLITVIVLSTKFWIDL